MIFSSMWEFAMWLSLMVGKDMAEEVDNAISGLNPSGVVVVTDENVNNMVIPFFGASKWISKAPKVIVAPGENNKNIDSLCKIWENLSSSDVTRNGLVVNIGGGMVTDMGGFAAATFKRGIRYVNIPTTLLGATDAATGGKTAVNFMGLKNEIGAFHVPSETLFFPQSLSSLPRRDLLAVYAEMVKAAMIADSSLYKKLLDVESVLNDSSRLEQTVGDCVKIKEEIVALDPYEKGLRKVLNLGHTAGHAFESFLLNHGREIRHGEAVAHGLLVALILSHLKLKLPSEEIWRYANEFLKTEFSRLPIDCSAIEELTALMAHDKKNERKGELKFVLLREIGSPLTDCTVSEEELQEALELYCDIMG